MQENGRNHVTTYRQSKELCALRWVLPAAQVSKRAEVVVATGRVSLCPCQRESLRRGFSLVFFFFSFFFEHILARKGAGW